MKRYGIERQIMLVTLVPILVMAVLLESYFIYTRFSDLENSLLERAQLLTRQLATSSEYAVFSGNTVLLKQNVDAALSFGDVSAIAFLDSRSQLILEAGRESLKVDARLATDSSPVYQNADMLRLYEPILATQVSLDGLLSAAAPARKLGAVVVKVSKQGLNAQKREFLFVSLLTTLIVFLIALLLALRWARSITRPVMKMHRIVRRIGAGDLETHFTLQCNIHELHELANGLRDMTGQLLRDRDIMESRILDATYDLRVKKEEAEQARLEKEQLSDELSIALSELQAIMEANPDLLYVFNTHGALIQWNSNLEKFCGLSREQLMKRHITEFVRREERQRLSNVVLEILGKGSAAIDIQLLRHDGVFIPYLCNGVVLKNSIGETIGFTGSGRDVSESKAAAEHIYHMAHFDLLTDLPNRSLLSDRLKQAIMTCKRERTQLALMFLDLDMFKYINDKLGHDVGDLLLKDVAGRILACLRETDTAARIGGDEFVVLLQTVDSIDTAMLVAEKIRHVLSMPFDIGGHSLMISTSIGIAVYPEHGGEEKTLLKNADTAMYLGKQKGRNTVVLFPS